MLNFATKIIKLSVYAIQIKGDNDGEIHIKCGFGKDA